MIYDVKGTLYVRQDNTFVRCVLSKSKDGKFYLKYTKGTIGELKGHYAALTMQEVIAKYGALVQEEEVKKEG